VARVTDTHGIDYCSLHLYLFRGRTYSL